MIGHAATVLVASFLLFQLQPLFARTILPSFGGGPAVWTACLCFFQVGLLLGYAYAHLLTTRCAPRIQAIVHLALLTASLTYLPIAPQDTPGLTASGEPLWQVLGLLAQSIGLPYVVLSTTTPLLDRWRSWAYPSAVPYRLYSLSNTGSLLGLVTYPWLVEPALELGSQRHWWSVGYGVYAAGIACCAIGLVRRSAESTQLASTAGEPASDGPLPRMGHWALWLGLSACGSVLLLATTNQMCQEIPPVPFLWVLPLVVYFASFVLVFRFERCYDRILFGAALMACLVLVAVLLARGASVSVTKQLGVYSAMLFVGCMVCHGELVRHKPPPAYSTGFYLSMAAGGALGGLFVAGAAPLIFDGYWEFPLALLATYLVYSACFYRQEAALVQLAGRWRTVSVLAIGFAGVGAMLGKHVLEERAPVIAAARNFHGVLRVVEVGRGTDDWRRSLTLGRIEQGVERLVGDGWKRPPYYGAQSGLAIALDFHPRRTGARNAEQSSPAGRSPGAMRIGVIGMGAGMASLHARAGDQLRFYELNPAVPELAHRYFSYLQRTPARWDVVLGDARISLRRELDEGKAEPFDLLVVDAYSGGAIPVHLLTREAFRLYLDRLDTQGVLAVHVSQMHIDLHPLVRGLAAEEGLEAGWAAGGNDDWILVARPGGFLAQPAVARAIKPWPPGAATMVWTDDHVDLVSVLRSRPIQRLVAAFRRVSAE